MIKTRCKSTSGSEKGLPAIVTNAYVVINTRLTRLPLTYRDYISRFIS